MSISYQNINDRLNSELNKYYSTVLMSVPEYDSKGNITAINQVDKDIHSFNSEALVSEIPVSDINSLRTLKYPDDSTKYTAFEALTKTISEELYYQVKNKVILDDISDVDLTGLSQNEVLFYNGSVWSAGPVSAAATFSHNQLSDLTNYDNHTQYHNDARGDIRYYTKSELDTNFLTITSANSLFYTKSQSDLKYLTQTSADSLYLYPSKIYNYGSTTNIALSANNLGQIGIGTAPISALDVNGGIKGNHALFGSLTNNTTIEPDGTIVRYGNATVWEDISFPLIVKTTGAGRPIYAIFTGTIESLQWAINDVAQAMDNEIPHAHKLNSTMTWHVHFYTGVQDASDRYVKWEIAYTGSNYGQQLPTETVISAEFTIPANTPIRTHYILDIGTFTPVNESPGYQIKARLKRIAASGTAPSVNPFCELMQIHYERDMDGSRQITTK